MQIAPEQRKVTGQLGTESVKFDFHKESWVHLQEQFINLYGDREMAVLREYATNGLDSHIEAGQTRPVEVWLPTDLSPMLRIKDYGVGLDWDDICSIYTQYGASSKRVSGNLQTGALGLGSKSGLCYADQFTITAIKDGIRTTASCTRDEEGQGVAYLVERIETDEPNGVEVSITAKRYNEFAEKAAKLFQYWPRGSVVVNGEEPIHLTDKSTTLKISDELFITTGRYGKSVIVMGNVPYPIETRSLGLDDLDYETHIVAYVPLDTVNFTNNREALRDTKKTQKALETIGEQVRDTTADAMAKDVDQAPTTIEALKRAAAWSETLPKSLRPESWTYQGQDLPGTFDLPNYLLERFTVVNNQSSKLSQHSRLTSIPFQTAVRAIWFKGYTSPKFTAGQRKKINLWKKETGLTAPHYILVKDAPDTTLIDSTQIHDWEDVKKLKLERAWSGGGGSTRPVGSYDCLKPSTHPTNHTISAFKSTIQADAIPVGPVYYFIGEATVGRWETPRDEKARPYAEALFAQGPCTVLLIPDTREAKLLREYPRAKPLLPAAKELATQFLATLSDDGKMSIFMQMNQPTEYRTFNNMDLDRIDDPELQEMALLCQLDYSSEYQRYNALRFMMTETERELGHSTYTSPLQAYPLYSWGELSDHVYWYLNSVYAATQEGTL